MATYYIKLGYVTNNVISKNDNHLWSYTQITPAEYTIVFDVETEEDKKNVSSAISELHNDLLTYKEVSFSFFYKKNNIKKSCVITNVVMFETDFDYSEELEEN